MSLNGSALSGITPACAGIREAEMVIATGQRDHPRVRGDKFDNAKIRR